MFWDETNGRGGRLRGRNRRQKGSHYSRARLRREFEPLEDRHLLSATMFSSHSGDSDEPPSILPLPPAIRLTAGDYLSGPAAGAPADIAIEYLKSHASSFGATADDFSASLISSQTRNAASGVTNVYLTQRYNGIDVENTNLNVTVGARGEIVQIFGNWARGLHSTAATPPAPQLSPVDAARAAASALGLANAQDFAMLEAPQGVEQIGKLTGGNAADPISYRLAYFTAPDGRSVTLGWELNLNTPLADAHSYWLGVDASTGQLLMRVDLLERFTNAYNVVPFPQESPDDGAFPRLIVADPANPVASPFGWHDTNGQPGAEYSDTRGNNVFAQETRQLFPFFGQIPQDTDPIFRPSATNGLFDFPFNPSSDPVNYRAAATTNLFYVVNRLHDIHYVYGFDEASGNYQSTNYTGLGTGGDQVYANAQAGADFGLTDNAFFIPSREGNPGQIVMFVHDWRDTAKEGPIRDGDLDNGIIIHEYGHGVSIRLTGGPNFRFGLNALQSRAMGEGWSDFWALMFTQKATDKKEAAYPLGTYVLSSSPLAVSGLVFGGANGIRLQPYSFDLSKNQRVLSDYNADNEEHAAGEIWAAALWDLNWLLIDKYGFNPNIDEGYKGPQSGGNNLTLKLVMDALKLQPTNPTFGDARDAILRADELLTGGENLGQIWTAFARRGMGSDSSYGISANSTVVSNGFSQPSAFDDRITVHGVPTAINVLRNDFNLRGIDPRTVQIVGQPLGGTASVGADGQITYTPSKTNFQPFDQIAYTYKNLLGGASNTAIVRIVNQQPPTAVNDAAVIAGTATTSTVTIDLLANDTDVENDINKASVVVVTQPKHGTVSIDQAGVATYTAAAGFFGLDSFQYTVKDQNGNTSNIATVSIRVSLPNTAPVAVNDTAETIGTKPVVINVLANDTDAEGRVVPGTVLVIVPQTTPPTPRNSVTTVDRVTGAITYQAKPGFFGSDSFTYTVQDDQGLVSNTATVTVTVGRGTNAPVAKNDQISARAGVPIDINVLGNDTDADGDIDVTTVLASGAQKGVLVVNNVSGVVTYTPNADAVGTDSFTYTVKDTRGVTSNVAMVTIVFGDGGSISGVVYIDANGNGRLDSGELGISNVTIIATLDANPSFKQFAKTNDRGYYAFTDLVAGTYTITEVQPTFFIDGLDSPGTPPPQKTLNDQFQGITIGPTGVGIDFNFGELGLRDPFAQPFIEQRAFLAANPQLDRQINLAKGDAWFAFDSGFNGRLTATAQSAAGSGAIALSLYTSDLKLVKQVSGAESSLSLGYTGVPGRPYLLKLSGAAAVRLDTKVTNAVTSDWQNAANRLDVNLDGKVTPLDALSIIDEINLGGASWLEDVARTIAGKIDVTGDAKLSPLDALAVIDSLNAPQSSGPLSAADDLTAIGDLAFALAVQQASEPQPSDALGAKKKK